MKNFKDLNIQPSATQSFTGDKVKMHKVLNREIVVHDFKIEPSKFNSGSAYIFRSV